MSLTGPVFRGETLPAWISIIKGPPSVLDASAVLHTAEDGVKSLRVAVVNRSETEQYTAPLRVAFFEVSGREIEVHELWHPDTKARNTWGQEDEVSIRTYKARWRGKWTFREHSFTMLIIYLS